VFEPERESESECARALSMTAEAVRS